MAGKHRLIIFVIAALTMTASVDLARSTDSLKPGVDFSGFSGGSVLNWLGSKGFEPKQDARNTRRVVYSALPSAIALETKTRAFGLLLNERDVRDYSRVRIEWGVDAFPSGASYEEGARAEAIMVYIFFGKERHSSGSLFIPDSPYFLALYLCETETTNKPFKGRYHHAIGRFICVERPRLGATVKTDFPVADTFRRVFGKEAPDISGIALAIDTANANGTGVAKSFIRKIEFAQ
ncbi:MAG: DUF3047 domain-containing protein [Nitrospira sp. BO4]|nr:DUF3047 domain-containing protein [Nitrospira sp. BO4]